jgi:trehalose/maltose transport system substrate-binding protein
MKIGSENESKVFKENMHMKKVFLLALVLTLALASVGFVSAQDDMGLPVPCPEGDAVVNVAGGAVGTEFELVSAQLAAYMEMCPNVTANLVEMPDQATDRLALYQQFWQAESSDIDVLQTDVIWAGIIAPHVVNLSEYLPEGYLDQFFPAMVTGQNIDGSQVAIPWFTDAAGLYYRTDLLEKYGLEVPATWDELTTVAQTIQDGERAEGMNEFYGYVWQGNAYEGLTCDAHEWLVSETGESFITPDGTVNVNNPEFVAALERAAGWVNGISPEAVTTYGEEESRATWQAGNAAFMRNWPYAYNLGNADDSAVAGMFGYAPLPAGAAGAAACLGGWQLAVSKYSDNIDAAVSVAAYLAAPEQQKMGAIEAGRNPTIPSLYDDPELAANNAVFDSMGPILATAFPRPSGITGERYNEASTIFFSYVHDVLTGQSDAQTAVEDMEVELQDLVDSLGM